MEKSRAKNKSCTRRDYYWSYFGKSTIEKEKSSRGTKEKVVSIYLQVGEKKVIAGKSQGGRQKTGR